MKKLLFIASFMLIAIFTCTSVYAADLPAADSNGTITLTADVTTITTQYTVPSTVKVIDLGGKTLNLKAGIVANNSLVIKNGTITRDAAFTINSMIVIDGATADFELDGVTIDGKKVPVTHTAGEYGAAIFVKSGKDITLNDSTIVYHEFDYAGIVSVSNSKNVYVIGTEISNNTAKDVGTLTVAYCENFEFYADSIIRNNVAEEAGGIHIEYTDAIIAGTIENNKTTFIENNNGNGGNGGGLYVFLNDQFGSNAEAKTVIIAETAKIINNTAEGAGGGVYVTGNYPDALIGKVFMMGGLISGNTAKGTPVEGDALKDGGGAGIYVARGNMDILGGIIENNTSTCDIGHAILVSNQGKNTQSGKLNIYGGYVDGTVKVSDTYGELAVEGGAFTDDVSAHIVAGLTSKEVDGVNYVGKELTVTVKAGANGKAVAAEKAVHGQPVKVTVTPDKNYELASIKVTDEGGKPVTVKDNTFIMPETDVTVEVTFKEMKKDNTPATGSMNILFVVSSVVAIVVAGMLVSKKYAKNN